MQLEDLKTQYISGQLADLRTINISAPGRPQDNKLRCIWQASWHNKPQRIWQTSRGNSKISISGSPPEPTITSVHSLWETFRHNSYTRYHFCQTAKHNSKVGTYGTETFRRNNNNTISVKPDATVTTSYLANQTQQRQRGSLASQTQQ